MARVCLEAEKEYLVSSELRRLQGGLPETIEEAIARATMFTAGGLKIRAIAALTQSGRTVLLMSRRSSNVPIFALSPQEDTRRKMTLFRGVYPVKIRWRLERSRDYPESCRKRIAQAGRCAQRRPDYHDYWRTGGQSRRDQHDEDRQGRRIQKA